ncbi:radical SAM protein, putative [Plasmodium knowlesi strain H]|uniref:tRNA carboxymethyluridine synthase n=3 Tax=Plasmodium knowlesi TaxID=5850 RepID=A0A5K1U4Y0_PLAKH|nr:elongator complex protein 3, putative [Plasmodium knowlesi strain H]OTN63742.1 putative Radical SAM protein [Plasmodium knowlesi]CAA9991067.1 elongator complex protein 3, putative [Plasmodium knowlesi strain H]SBO20643.1 radical SAM protein, putative [Plasmodium knowlesi strain H]SBO21056.1 radical SAM protein, putative [Plasmodium knowlesi strain H]VVS80541.1 elongator complex protein 3, putative [Plasmodium knowlesi strain H]|eukprot:XP_002262349.1 radical SAM protein, putative [Plasmodium knowlesi strain H]
MGEGQCEREGVPGKGVPEGVATEEVRTHPGQLPDDKVDEILGEVSDDEGVGREEGCESRPSPEGDYFYINDAIKHNYPLEYEENKIYPKVYCYEPTNFENFKKKIKNKNELRHYECYSSTMNEFFYKYNDNYYDDILKNESFKKFAFELWSKRKEIKNETEYHNMCIQLRKKYKVCPSKHQISVALQHHYLQAARNSKGGKDCTSSHVDEPLNVASTSHTSDVSNQSNQSNVGGDATTNEEEGGNTTSGGQDGDQMDFLQGKILSGEGLPEWNAHQGCEKMDEEREKKPTNVVTTTEEEEEDKIEVNKKGKDVKFVLETVTNMIVTTEMKNYKDLDKDSVHFLQINKRKGVRSNSGVLVVTIITHPHKFSCKYDCYYCPNEPNQPRSYLSTEPAILRANQNNFDVICQFFNRTTTLVNNGHVADKIEVLVLGGTWSSYDVEYQREFIRDVYYAANIYPLLKNRRKKFSLEKEQEINETSNCRIIGLTLETRPDQINKEELIRLRSYGCTRVQLGIQHTDDFILKKVNRQCTLQDAIRAIYLLKENGFKVDIHLMPDLPYSDVKKDIEMFKHVLSSPNLQADQWKIYPCEITPFTRIEKWYNNNEFKPYFETDKNLLICLIFLVKKSIHPWIRLNRVIRDIPNPSIIAGNNITNMRQLIANEMNIRSIFCQCIRCKEVKNQEIEKKEGSIFLQIYQYQTLGGEEFFLTFQGVKKVRKGAPNGAKKKKGKKKEEQHRTERNVNSGPADENSSRSEHPTQVSAAPPKGEGVDENFIGLSSVNLFADGGYEDGNIQPQSGGENIEVDMAKGVATTNRASTTNRVTTTDGMTTSNEVNAANRLTSLHTRDDKNEQALLGFLRLRLRNQNDYCDDRPFKCLEGSALIRELHVYGSLLKHDDFKEDLNFVQHKGLGKCLVLVAELIAYHYGYRKVSIIAGVGTREYYKKLGYEKEETYVTKELKKECLYQQYLLNADRIGKQIFIHKYNLEHCLYLMHRSIPTPSRYKRSEIEEDMNTFISENIITLGSDQYLHCQQECSEVCLINIVPDLLVEGREKHTILTKQNKQTKNISVRDILSQWTGKILHSYGTKSWIRNAYFLFFFSTTMFVGVSLWGRRRMGHL